MSDGFEQQLKTVFEEKTVLVLGAGIAGLTTALVLQSRGHKVLIIADHFPRQESFSCVNPLVATDYAMASAYPHNLAVVDLERISDASQAILSRLCKLAESGLSLYQIFEVYEDKPAMPPLQERRMNFTYLCGEAQELARNFGVPARPGAQELHAFSFRTYFADMPIYLAFLWSVFKANGGKTLEQKIDSEELLILSRFKPLINCLGISSIRLFQDRASVDIMRGTQVLVPDKAPLISQDGLPLCYNYTPKSSVYSRGDGLPEYVHFFPRRDGWLLGQTRESGYLDDSGCWQGKAVNGKYRDIEGIAVPEPIISLNKEILQNWQGHSFSDQGLKARQGLRFYRSPQAGGMRLGLDDNPGIIHNYGLAGSGITMSWGCAIKTAITLEESFSIRGLVSVPAPDIFAPLVNQWFEQLSVS